MVQLKTVALRLKSIKNIQKITKTMKMVSASKFTKAERELKAARPFGHGTRKFYEGTHLTKPVSKDEKGKEKPPEPAAAAPDVKAADKKQNLIHIAVTSDRGLCGGVHSGIARRIKRSLDAIQAAGSPHHKIVCIGDKSRTMLRRSFPNNMLISVKEIGRIAPSFSDASALAAAVSDANYKYDHGQIYYNKYFTPVKYELTLLPFFTQREIEMAPNMTAYDDVDEDMLESFAEFTLAATLYYVLKESAASEQSARMSAMDNATKNASEMIKKLTLLFNRTRQAVITRELIEIISGAAALQ